MSTSSHSSPTLLDITYTQVHGFFFATETPLGASSTRPATYSVSDNIVTFTPSPTPHSRCSLSHIHKFMGFFRNRNDLSAASTSPTTYSVSRIIVAFTPVPTPRSHSSLSHTHSIHTPTGVPSPRPRSSRLRAHRSSGFLCV
jgi:hypothetical protein